MKTRRGVVVAACLGAPFVFVGCALSERTIVEQQLLEPQRGKPTTPELRVLFVFRDAGESLALLPVLQHLHAKSPNVSAIGLVTGYGTAPASILSEPGVRTLSSLGVPAAALANRSATLPDAAIRQILAATQPGVLVTGVVSAVQLQLAHAALDQGVALVAGYDDGLSTADQPTSWPLVALRSGSVSELWVVAQDIARIQERHAARWQHVKTVGSPALEAWPAKVRSVTPTELATLRRTIYGVGPSVPVVLFFGGYGEGYAESVQMFAEAAAQLQRRPDPSAACPVAIAFARHPGPNITTDLERRIFAAAGVQVTLVEGVASPLLAAAANMTASQDSTASDQALFVGTPSVFAVAPGAPAVANIGVAAGLIPVARSREAFVAAFAAARASGFTVPHDALKRLGVPSGAEARIADMISAHELSRSPTTSSPSPATSSRIGPRADAGEASLWSRPWTSRAAIHSLVAEGATAAAAIATAHAGGEATVQSQQAVHEWAELGYDLGASRLAAQMAHGDDDHGMAVRAQRAAVIRHLRLLGSVSHGHTARDIARVERTTPSTDS